MGEIFGKLCVEQPSNLWGEQAANEAIRAGTEKWRHSFLELTIGNLSLFYVSLKNKKR
jgi:hypothetical protein